LTVRRTARTLKHVLNHEDELDGVFRALADPTRRAIVTRLVDGPASVGELAAPLAMSLSAVMQHLEVLRSCGLVRTAKHGRVRTCTLDPAGLRLAEEWLRPRRTGWESALDRLAEQLGSSRPGSRPDGGEQP
jgi:DNA-binding transcriptional ArsR family regulator